MAGKNLLIVESPGKIKTLSKFLGSDFIVEASKGHIVDLPESRIGVDVESGFVPIYQVSKTRADVIKKIKDAAERSDRIYLAPDPDREGEAISWHLANILDVDPFSPCRVTFNSITKEEVLKAISNPRSIDLNLVSAQQSRRILDRIVGYKLSPLLWKKVCMGLSAGRVQSVAVLFICKREQEILAFNPEEYWTIKAILKTTAGASFETKLAKYKGKKAVVPDSETSEEVLREIHESEPVVEQVTKRAKKTSPPPPFITSTLQQEASYKFSFTSKRTMSLAQKLYEGIEVGNEGQVGLITYMRTDSVRISPEGLSEAKDYIETRFDKSYSLPHPRHYKTKQGAQDAHEAIRPTSVKRTPEQLSRHLSADELKLYSLIWKRFVATQMAESIHDILTIDISAGKALLQATGSTLVFDGFTALYTESAEESSETESDNSKNSEEKQKLPQIEEGEKLKLRSVDSKQNFTLPPARYSESILIKTLEKEGIGRPSTYATIIETIQQRGYVSKVDGRFKPSDAAFLTTSILTGSFKDVINPKFTASMETLLDEIGDGKIEWVKVLSDFYQPFIKDLKRAEENLKKVELGSDCFCIKCGRPMIVKLGITGKFLACTGYPECKTTENIPEEIVLFAQENEERSSVKLRETLDKIKERDGTGKTEPTGEICETCGAPMSIRTGRFGRFVACDNYPECKSTKPLLESTGVKCPMEGCSGTIVIKKSKRRRTFYACSKYPECKLTLWAKPTGKPCPTCGAPLIFHSTKKLGEFIKCSVKTCEYKEFPEESEVKE
ncbi:MAG: type I DNA topoisomerase [Candidatus Riflebacteria bacterium]|nr:type I DNA topoisomerase [Candidatus Riflebacteria bacterium]